MMEKYQPCSYHEMVYGRPSTECPDCCKREVGDE